MGGQLSSMIEEDSSMIEEDEKAYFTKSKSK
jgi:hypothetical protein